MKACPWCEEILEPRQDEDGYWIPGLIGHSCEGYDAEKLLQDARHEEWEEERRQERWETACRLAGMSGRRAEMTFENFDSGRQADAFWKAEHFFTAPESLVFCGPVGTGKTHLACAILHRWLLTGFEKEINEPWGPWTGGRGLFITLPRLLLRIQATYKQQNPSETEESIIEHLVNLPLLILDDVGKQKKSEYSQRVLFNVVDGRYVKGKHIIITSNLSGGAFAEDVGEAVASRLLEMGKTVTMEKADDYRDCLSAARRVKG